MPKTRRQYAGGSVASTLGSSVAATGVTAFTIASATGWPSSAGVPLFVVVSPQTSSEEKMSVTISGTTLTVVSRGVDGTTAASHSSGAIIYPVFTATDADEANELTAKYATQGSIVYQGASTFTELALGTSGYPLVAGASAPAYSQLTSTGIADGAVTSGKILNGTIVLADLAAALQAFLVPVGTIAMWGAVAAPSGWLLCDGTSTSGYSTLASLVGATTPDMRGRFPIGDNATLTLLGTGGSLSITEANLPSHSHSITHDHAAFTSGDDSPDHDHGYTAAVVGTNPLLNASDTSVDYAFGTTGAITGGARQRHAHNINVPEFSGTSSAVGSGTNYYPPHLVVNYIIKHD